MLLALVHGSATSTRKHETLTGWRMLVCQSLNVDGQPDGDPFIAMDRLGAGKGDQVLVSSDGKGMAERVGSRNTPARWFTVGLPDEGGR